MAWKKDFALHRHFKTITQVMNIIFGWLNIQLGTDYQDMYLCTDIVSNQGKMGVRIRNANYPYRDFTIRTRLMLKIATSPITHYFYAYLNDKKQITLIYVINMESIRKTGVLKLFMNNYKSNGDGTAFYFLSMNRLKHFGCIDFKATIKNGMISCL